MRSTTMHPLLRGVQVYVKKSKFLRFGLPFLSFMVLGSFGLAEFTEIRVGTLLRILDVYGNVGICFLGEETRRKDAHANSRRDSTVPEESNETTHT